MSTCVAFLRAINVGGHTVKMDHLRTLFEKMGFTDVATFIASGNVMFSSRSRTPSLEKKIETELEKALGYEVATFVRSMSEVVSIAEYQPFSSGEMESAGALNVAFLKSPLSATAKNLNCARY